MLIRVYTKWHIKQKTWRVKRKILTPFLYIQRSKVFDLTLLFLTYPLRLDTTMNTKENNRLTRRSLLRTSSALAFSSLGLPAFAQTSTTPNWPSKPVRLVVAGPAGANADVVARALSEALNRSTKQAFIVDNKPGAAGVIAVNDLLAAPQDGLTLMVGVSSLVSEIPHIVKMRQDMRKAIVPLAQLSRGGLVLVTAPDLPVKSLKDVIDLSKSKADGLSYASYSPGTMSHVAGLLLAQSTGAKLTHVGYKGSTPALNDVMGGHIPLMFDGLATSLPFIRAGKIKAIAISSPQRSPLLPEVPTFKELGQPELTYTGWMGLWASSTMPAHLQQQIHQQVHAALNDPTFKNTITNAGFETSSLRDSAALHAELVADYERVGKVLAGTDVKL